MQLIKRLMTLTIIMLVLQIAPVTITQVYAADSVSNSQGVDVKNPSSDLWRAVRQRQFSGQGDIKISTQVKGLNAGRFINAEGNKWRQLRRQKLIPYTASFVLGVMGLLILLFLFVKRAKIPNGKSGKKISRLSIMQRTSHWILVVLVGFMALTGLTLLFGRFGIIPLIGVEAFSPLASFSKEGHNISGPIMIVSILLLLIYYIRYNLPGKGDLKWLLAGGGIFTKKHLKNGFFNAGEKLLFWWVIILGLVLSVTGLMLLFPNYEQTVNMSQLALVVHAVAAILLIAVSLAHIFMAIKVEGTIDAITSGDVDRNWAKAHHALWYEESIDKPFSQNISASDLSHGTKK